MSERLIILISVGFVLGQIGRLLMVIIFDKIEDARQKKRLKENLKKIENGTWVGAPYYPGAMTTSADPIATNNQ